MVTRVRIEAVGATVADVSRELHALRNYLDQVQGCWVQDEHVQLRRASTAADPDDVTFNPYEGRLVVAFPPGGAEAKLTAAKVEAIVQLYCMRGTPTWKFDQQFDWVAIFGDEPMTQGPADRQRD